MIFVRYSPFTLRQAPPYSSDAVQYPHTGNKRTVFEPVRRRLFVLSFNSCKREVWEFVVQVGTLKRQYYCLHSCAVRQACLSRA